MDGDAFRELTDPYRRELHVHCYRMLGSFQDAEDALQDTLLAAWQSFGSFEGRSSVRTWLYRIATNRCLNARRAARRRPAVAWNVPGVTPPEPTSLGEAVWLQPYPDAALDYERTESLSLAFVTALQLLPPRQVAVLVLRDVLDFSALEVASMLDSSVDSVTSALKRARAGLRPRLPATPTASPPDSALVTRFVTAYEAADVEALVDLLTDDVFVSMPPMPFEYEGREAVRAFCANLFATRRYQLIPTSANGQPAFGTYVNGQGTGIVVLTLRGDRISAMTRFDDVVLPFFDLPPSLP